MNLLSEITTALQKRERVVLATIISSSGSTPLPTGSSMLITQDGENAAGTIGGGLLEADVTQAAKEFFANGRGSLIGEFELNDSAAGDGMICGGNVDVLIETIRQDELGVFSQLAVLQNSGSDCTLVRRIDTAGTVSRMAAGASAEDTLRLPFVERLVNENDVAPESLLQILQRARREERVERLTLKGGELIIQPVSGVQPLIICGGGHVGRAVSKIAAATGFVVTVVDDREDYAVMDRFPGATRTIAKNWSDGFADLSVTPSSFIVIVTRAHQSDREVLRLALRTPARYIGMIGSGRKVAATFDALQKEGIPKETLKRVHAPIGLEIGAVTAEEIAVSIVAELIRERRHFAGISTSLSQKMIAWFDQDHQTGHP